MIQVNVWLSTTQIFGKRIKNRFFGPLLASDGDENIGHANFYMELNERSRGFAKLEDNPSHLFVKKSLSYVPELVEGNAGKYYRRKTLRSVEVTHSFWPKSTPSRSQLAQDFFHFLHLAPKCKGVKPEISDHESDMQREVIGKGSTHPIEHPYYQEGLKKVDKDKKENLDKIVKTWNLDSDLDNKKNIQAQLNTLLSKQHELISLRDDLSKSCQKALDELKEKTDNLTNKLVKNNQKITFLHKKSSILEKIYNPANNTYREMKSVIQMLDMLQKKNLELSEELAELEKMRIQKQSAYQEQMQVNQTEIDQVDKEMSRLQVQLGDLNEKLQNIDETKIAALKSEINERADFLSRQEMSIKTLYKTDGRHPDHSISLPTSECGLRYFVDELAVIKAMENERNENYMLIKNNCAKSVKRCLLAGIDHLRTVLPKSFFKYQPIETTNGVYKWARALEQELTKLNMKLNVDETSPCIDVNEENDVQRSIRIF